MLTKVLVPLDGSEHSESVLPYISQLASGLGMALSLLAVIDADSIQYSEGFGAIQRKIENAGGMERQRVLMEDVRARLIDIAGNLSAQGITADTTVVIGDPAEEIVELAEESQCDIIAMSTHGRNALGRGVFGSVTDRVTNASHIPTLAIAPESATEYLQRGVKISRVVLPLDGSALAETALPYVEKIAVKLSIEVHLVHVVRTPGAFAKLRNSGDSAKLLSEHTKEGREYLERSVETLKGKGISATYEVRTGTPAEEIVKVTQGKPENMVALTTRGHSGITRWTMGSVAHKLVRASRNPVLVIPPTNVL